MRPYPTLLLLLLILCSCGPAHPPNGETAEADATDSAAIRMIPITTPRGSYEVFTRRHGNNPDTKVLLLHGGPGANSSYFEVADDYFPAAGVEYYYYDQLGSLRSDVPTDTSLWTIERFVDEVDQVRRALGLDADNCYLLGHSWGGILGVEYALRYPDKLRGLIISNMMMDVPAYNRYATEVLEPALPPDTLAKLRAYEAAGDFGNPDYLSSVYANYYPRHVLRGPLEEWPEPVLRGFEGLNEQIYVGMQGPSEMGIKGNASLRNWSRMADLGSLDLPVLVISGRDDTMDPAHLARVADAIPHGELLATDGTHFAMWDDRDTYWPGVIDWLRRTEAADAD